MPIDPGACGTTGTPVERAWTSTDCILYALAVGAGRDEPFEELAFTTENTRGVAQQVLPTFGTILGRPTPDVLENVGSFDPARLVQAGQTVVLHRPLPVEGRLRATTTITDIEDKGSGALVAEATESVDASSGERILTTVTSLFVRGAGGFDAARKRVPRDTAPRRPADSTVTYATLPGQALLYRLCGDRNPLHSDPAFARAAGFHQPILHGLCVYGFAGRALLQAMCDGDPARFGRMEGRFSRPTRPGDSLTVSMWFDDDGRSARFTTATQDGTVVLADGRFERRS